MTYDDDLRRVTNRIGDSVLTFCAKAHRFRMGDLTEWVRRTVGEVAPDSPGRILRDLKRRGLVNYRLVSRSESLYEMQHAGQGELFGKIGV